jgi:hypothetical protein
VAKERREREAHQMSWMHTPSAERALSLLLYTLLCAQEGLGTERPPHHHHPGRAYGFSNQHGSSNGERAHTREREIHFMCLTADALYPPLESISFLAFLFSPHSQLSQQNISHLEL